MFSPYTPTDLYEQKKNTSEDHMTNCTISPRLSNSLSEILKKSSEARIVEQYRNQESANEPSGNNKGRKDI